MPRIRQCCVPDCDWRENMKTVSLHAVKPKWKSMLQNRCRLSEIDVAFICSKHFPESMVFRVGTRNMLYSYAVPSLHLPEEQNVDNNSDCDDLVVVEETVSPENNRESLEYVIIEILDKATQYEDPEEIQSSAKGEECDESIEAVMWEYCE
ncbi:uncharacterized protein [Musca autumnalis]|uniref:uncharacterized protein n=1 Tax=Musca autumnalis TaxID=221902 RepID=UPI003CF96412